MSALRNSIAMALVVIGRVLSFVVLLLGESNCVKKINVIITFYAYSATKQAIISFRGILVIVHLAHRISQ